jgi:hypothetical protein
MTHSYQQWLMDATGHKRATDKSLVAAHAGPCASRKPSPMSLAGAAACEKASGGIPLTCCTSAAHKHLHVPMERNANTFPVSLRKSPLLHSTAMIILHVRTYPWCRGRAETYGCGVNCEGKKSMAYKPWLKYGVREKTMK